MADQGTTGVTASWQVPEAEKPIRAGAFARRCLPHLSRREIEQAIRDRLFRVNGKTVKKGDQLSAGNRLDFVGPPSWLAVRPVPNERLRVPIVYEDPALLIVDKPAGLAVHGFSARTDNTLANFLAAQRAALLEVGKSRWEPGMVHRLDRETSGLVVIAKTPETFDHLRRQFRERKVEKIYLALVWGESRAEGVIDFPLAHDPRDKKRMRAMTERGARKRIKNLASHHSVSQDLRDRRLVFAGSRNGNRCHASDPSSSREYRSSDRRRSSLWRSTSGNLRAPTALFACLEIAIRSSHGESGD